MTKDKQQPPTITYQFKIAPKLDIMAAIAAAEQDLTVAIDNIATNQTDAQRKRHLANIRHQLEIARIRIQDQLRTR